MLNLLSEIGKLAAKPCHSPMAQNLHLTRKGELFEDLTVTCPNIVYSVSVISQYMSYLTVDHWTAVEHIICYLKRASGRGILYSNHGYNKLECFMDVDWAGSKEDIRSTSGYCVFV